MYFLLLDLGLKFVKETSLVFRFKYLDNDTGLVLRIANYR